jgi:hypothetical protein
LGEESVFTEQRKPSLGLWDVLVGMAQYGSVWVQQAGAGRHRLGVVIVGVRVVGDWKESTTNDNVNVFPDSNSKCAWTLPWVGINLACWIGFEK